MPFITEFNGKIPPGEDAHRPKRVEPGALENARKTLLNVLQDRFGDVPGGVLNSLDAIDNPQVLRTLMREAVKAPTLSAFLSKLPL